MKSLLILLLLNPAFAQEDDVIEDKWHEIYSQYYNKALTETEWGQIAGEKINETYKIQKGDTLWDISTTLFGNGYYWPKIWQLNSDITNPHSITSGYEIHFQAGTTEQAPEIKIVEPKGANPTPVNVTKGKSDTYELTAVPVIPPPAVKSRPVIQKIPPSLPVLIARKQENNYDRSGFSLDFKEMEFEKDTMILPSYLTDDTPDEEGKIVEAEGDQTQAGSFQYIYVKIDKGEIGKKFIVYNVGKKLVDPVKQTRVSGTPIYIEGEIETTELVNADDNIYKALVTKAISPVHIGSYVLSGKLERIDLTPSKDFTKIPTKVVGGEFEHSRYNLGYYSLVYFNAGSEAGIKQGQMIRIYKNEKLRKESWESKVKKEEQVIATAKIVNVTEEYSTGIVLEAKAEIKLGDFAGESSVIKEDDLVGSNDIQDEVSEEAKTLKQEPSEVDEDSDTNPEDELDDE